MRHSSFGIVFVLLVLASLVPVPRARADSPVNLRQMQFTEATTLLPPGSSTQVAVLDTGADAAHPVLSVLVPGCDMFLNRCGIVPRDTNGHGTHVAGIVAQAAGERVRIRPYKVSMPHVGAIRADDAIEAVYHAIDHGAKVINVSFGGPCDSTPSKAWHDVIGYAESKDVLLVMAAGNTSDCRAGRYPSSDPRVLAVAATVADGSLAPFSNRGDWVDVAAPGAEILSTLPNGAFGKISGTSQAAPHVTALAALLFQVPGATKAKVTEWITSTCDYTGIEVGCGGRVNAYRAVQKAVTGTDPAH